ncbi:MAG TPA: hypothetical protein V6D09_18795 [Leptolyngbyaceae cyanobacterium]
MNANQNHLVLAPLFIYGEKRKSSLYQVFSFNYGAALPGKSILPPEPPMFFQGDKI